MVATHRRNESSSHIPEDQANPGTLVVNRRRRDHVDRLLHLAALFLVLREAPSSETKRRACDGSGANRLCGSLRLRGHDERELRCSARVGDGPAPGLPAVGRSDRVLEAAPHLDGVTQCTVVQQQS
jgi:hypothetical protein